MNRIYDWIYDFRKSQTKWRTILYVFVVLAVIGGVIAGIVYAATAPEDEKDGISISTFSNIDQSTNEIESADYTLLLRDIYK